MTVLTDAVRVDLLRGCSDPGCLEMAAELHYQLNPAYSRGAAVMSLRQPLTWRRTARRRSERAGRLGYVFKTISRQERSEEIYRINTSKAERQGRPMSKGYQEHTVYGPEPMVCPLHHVYTYGVVTADDELVAYLWLYRSGQLAMVSSILGHADHLENSVMYRLFVKTVAQQTQFGGTLFYNMWNSGSEGLRFFKERVGLREGDVEWVLG